MPHTTLRPEARPLAVIVAELLEAEFGLTGAIRPLESERDLNFLISDGEQPRYVAKLINAEESRITTDFQTALLLHLNASAEGLPVPNLIRSMSGAALVEFLHEGQLRILRVVCYKLGQPYAKVSAGSDLRRALGACLAKVDRALSNFSHPGQSYDFDWDICKVGRSAERLNSVTDSGDRAIVEQFLRLYEQIVAPRLPYLRHGVIHNDANDWNVIVAEDGKTISGLIDFGDALFSPRVAEVAVAMTYAMMRTTSPLIAGCDVLKGYHAVMPLDEDEIACLFPMIAARLCISVTKAAVRSTEATDNPYLLISEKDAWDLLRQFARIKPDVATALFRNAVGLPASPQYPVFRQWLSQAKDALLPSFRMSPARYTKHVLPLDGSDPGLSFAASDIDHARAETYWRDYMRKHDFEMGIGLWHEQRNIYQGEMFRSVLLDDKFRDMHLGIDIFLDALEPLYAPLDGVVVDRGYGPEPLDFGGVILLRHTPEPDVEFYTLWGHLDPGSIDGWNLGDKIVAGTLFARLGDRPVNGGWLPHLHFQLATIGFDKASEVPGVGETALEDLWCELFPDPAEFLLLPPETFRRTGLPKAELLEKRCKILGHNLSVSFPDAPLKMVRGQDVWLIDDTGRAYLDCFNNVAHVGHEHPRVVKALSAQAAKLNTNTRYLHDGIVEYAERLTATLPDPLSVCFFVNSGSEANDLALRIVRAHTHRKDMIVVDWAYHGHGAELIEISPYKYKRAGGTGRPSHVHEVPLPDAWRAGYALSDPAAAEHFAQPVRELCDNLVRQGRPPAAFIAETVPSVGGQIFLPDDYLKSVYKAVRGAGGLCIADEVQVGMGRTGKMWAFEHQGVVPDIVTVGKPIGNGHPLAALITTPELAASFANGMEYFNTFGGNPVSCAVGLSVLDVLQDEQLIGNAREIGAFIHEGLLKLKARYALIGDVRSQGLFFGLDLVTDRVSKAPATNEARAIVKIAKEMGVLIGTDGPNDNVIKMRPPMTFQLQHADILLDCLGACFAEVTADQNFNDRGR